MTTNNSATVRLANFRHEHHRSASASLGRAGITAFAARASGIGRAAYQNRHLLAPLRAISPADALQRGSCLDRTAVLARAYGKLLPNIPADRASDSGLAPASLSLQQ
jgi:hypothetical protein